MKNFHLWVGLLGVLGLTLLAGCATESMSRTANAAPPATYAVVAVDNQGVLSAADFKKVQVGVIQYLLDEGYVRAEDHYVSDVLSADIVFRVRIAWKGAQGGFSVVEVKPTFSPRPYEQSEAGGGAATAYSPWYAAGGWYDNPWWYGDYYGSDFWPYAGFAGLSAYAPIYLGGRAGRREPDRDNRRVGGADYRARDHDRPGRVDRDDRGHVDGPHDHYARSGAPRWDPTHSHFVPAIGNGDHRDRPVARSRDEDHVRQWRTGHAASYRPGARRDGDAWRQRNRDFAAHRSDHSYRPARTSVPEHRYARPSQSYSRPQRSYSPPARSHAAPARSYSRPAAPAADREHDHDANSRRQEK